MPVPKAILEQLKQLIPPLNGSLHKGQSGRVGVLGGAQDYTGAPFCAAFSALRLGADLSHVICSPTAAPAIKSYSPDLIVHPILREDASNDLEPELTSLLSRLHVLVLGPGLGREPYMQAHAKLALSIARSQGMFVVLDADALWLVTQDPQLIRGYRRAVLTPNVMEFKRLSEKLGIQPGNGEGNDERASGVSRALGGLTIVQKGASDIIAVDTTGSEADPAESKVEASEKEEVAERIEVDTEGGYKRCGGQGDILSGTIGTMLAWGKCYEDGTYGDATIPTSKIPILAAAGGCMVTRTASRIAFAKQGRALVTQDMLPELGDAFAELFGEDKQFGDKGKL
ncbi:Ribokinase-like protein [Athelia psychrophila]|uniref:ATP-dependent (S)-NAD(P)H-hydrate dehydratase n=1 Tax=Athelia psychrophila TaxID=1759441 RepID=A0A166HY03_9AGAM|nr:Ribokinase-like protein [Fibularhizoctonia sp. CBS 109695]